MAAFHAKIGWKRLRKREYKNYLSVLFLPDGLGKIKRKKQKNFKELKKYNFGIISNQNRLEKAENERKQKLSFHFVSTRRVIENNNKIGKKFKQLKNTIMSSFQAKIGWKMQRKRENKNYRFIPFLPDCVKKIPKKIVKKI